MVGGMENLSYHLTTEFPGEKKIIALRRSQKHLVWFLPYVVLYVACISWKYDVIHLGDALLAIVGLIPRKLFRRKIIINLHGLDLTYQPRFYQWYLRTFLQAGAYVAISSHTASIAHARGLKNVRVIPVGLEDRWFSIKRGVDMDGEILRWARGRPVIITFGRLVPRKGAAWFLKNVLPQLHSAVYLIVGTGPDEHVLKTAIRVLHLEDRVRLLGELPDEQLFRAMRTSDIFVMPNIPTAGDVEGFGIVAIEAAAVGLPVVASNLEGIPDAIHPNLNGILVTPGDTEGYLQAIRSLLDHESTRRDLGARARQYTREHFSWQHIVEEYVDAFSSALRGFAV